MNFLRGIGSTLKNYVFGAGQDDEPEGQPEVRTASSSPHLRSASSTKRTAQTHAQPEIHQPVLQESVAAPGGVQGLSWFAARQRRDTHGDLAHEFLEEDGASQQARGVAVQELRVQRVQDGSVVLTTAGKGS